MVQAEMKPTAVLLGRLLSAAGAAGLDLRPAKARDTNMSLLLVQVLAHGRRNCPICRAEIRESDLFDACSEEEARLKEQAAAAGGAANADYGSKVGGSFLGPGEPRAFGRDRHG